MELHEANRILRAIKTAMAADGRKIPLAAETDGLMMLLGKLDADNYLAPKIKHLRATAPSSAAYERLCNNIIFFRALRAAQKSIADPVTAISVMLLHKSLFGDVDADAGKPRAKDACTDGNAHTDPKYVQGSLKAIVTKMNEIGSAPQTAKDDFAGYLSHYMRELVILHPFEQGSALTARVFCMLFCKLKGFGLGYHRTTPSAIRSAELDALAADDVTPLYKMLLSCLSYETKTSAPRRPTVRTRRELTQDLCRPPRREQDATVLQLRDESLRPEKRRAPDDEVLRRAIRLQQKISKLNDQLNELIQPLESAEDD